MTILQSDDLARVVHSVVKDVFRSVAEKLESYARSDERMDSATSSAVYTVAHVMQSADFRFHVNEALAMAGFDKLEELDDG